MADSTSRGFGERAPGADSSDPPTAEMAPVSARADDPTLRVRLFGSHAYFRLWLAQVMSSLGDWIGLVAVIALARRLGGKSPEAAISLVTSARIIPGFFLSQLAGVVVDRWNRKRVMVTCDLIRGAVMLSLPWLDTIWQLVLASLVLEVATLLWSPAKEASVPNLVPAEHLTTVNSLSLAAAYGTFPPAAILFSLLSKLAEWLSGFSAFHVLDSLNNESLALYFDALTFVLSALMISTLPLVHRRRSEEARRAHAEEAKAHSFVREIRDGWHFIFLTPIVRGVMVAIGCGFVGGGMLVPLGPLFARDVLKGGDATFGLMLTALGWGLAIGVIALSALQRRLPKAKVFTLAVFGAGASLVAAAAMSSSRVAFVFVLGLGVCAGAVYVLGFTVLHESVDDEFRGRTFSALYTLVRMCLLISYALGPFLSKALDSLSNHLIDRDLDIGIRLFLPGVRLTLWLAGVIIIGAAALALKSFRAGSPTGRMRDLDNVKAS
ncbi:MAG: MFS transporter [Acidimicrobiia bacterium]